MCGKGLAFHSTDGRQCRSAFSRVRGSPSSRRSESSRALLKHPTGLRPGQTDIARRPTMTLAPAMTFAVDGISIPDSKLAHEMTELVRDTESPLLFHHSSRVYYWAALAGKRRRLKYDAELL